MKIIMVVAVSKDGFITKGTDPNPGSWTSDEDKIFFKTIKSKHNLLVMGSKTYDSGLVVAHPGTLKIILTSDPEQYSSLELPGQLEFKNLTAQEFKDKYDSEYPTCLLLGGGFTYTKFLEANLVDEIYLTVESIELQSGISLLNNGKRLEDIINLPAPTKTILNNTGTTLYHYKY